MLAIRSITVKILAACYGEFAECVCVYARDESYFYKNIRELEKRGVHTLHIGV